MIQKSERFVVLSLFLITTLLSLVPVLQTLGKGDYWGIPPAYIDDDLYYYGRIKEVVDGKPLIGNPYFIEYRDATAAAFFIPDMIAAIPLALGVPLSAAIVINFILWSLVFTLLAYAVGRAYAMPPFCAAAMAFLAYCEVYWVILRPVVMQQIFPFFLLFLLAFQYWLQEPQQRRSLWLLALACAAPFYTYLFLWQIEFAILGIVFVSMMVQKKWPEVKSLLWVAFFTTMIALPVLVYTVYQLQAPLYWETAHRVGLVLTRLPSIDAYLYGRWAFLIVALFLCLRSWLGTKGVVQYIAIVSGLGLLVMTVSNVVTGQDIATASHIGRFITLWIALYFPVFVWHAYLHRAQIRSLHWAKLIIIAGLSLLCLGFLVSNLKRSLPFQRIARVDAVAVQSFAAPLQWLDAHEQYPVVIWANDEVSMYVPILTKHYVLWARPGGLHLMSSTDVEDRFLASRIGSSTVEELFTTYEWYAGAGALAEYADMKKKEKLACALGGECITPISVRSWVGSPKLEALALRQKVLKKDISSMLKRYSVAYLIADTTKKEETYFKSLQGAHEIWKNERFIIYEIK